MRDASANLFRAGRIAPRAAVAALLLAMACGLGGCATDGAGGGSFAMASGGPTVAFESIDGPPPQVFDRMVNVLDSESKLRSLSIVSRDGVASYRVRSYLSAQVNHGRTTVAWVWDVYDRDQQRTLRLSGEEPAGKAGRSCAAAYSASRIERPQRHDQRDGAGGCAAARLCARSRRTRPRGGQRGAACTRFGCIQRQRAGLQLPLTIQIIVGRLILPRKN